MATCLSTCLPVGGPNRVLQEALVLWSSTYVKTLPKLIWVPMNQEKVMFTWSVNLIKKNRWLVHFTIYNVLKYLNKVDPV